VCLEILRIDDDDDGFCLGAGEIPYTLPNMCARSWVHGFMSHNNCTPERDHVDLGPKCFPIIESSHETTKMLSLS